MATLKDYYNNAYGSTYVDPVSGMQSIIYAPVVSKSANAGKGTIINAKNVGKGKGKLSGWLGNNFGWNKQSGAKAFGKNIGGLATKANALIQGVNAIGNINNLTDTTSDTDAIVTNILRSSASNPLTSSYLTSDQQSLLNKLKRGSYNTEADFFDANMLSLLGGAGQGALSGGLIGGIPGAIVGGIGGLVNTGLQEQTQNQNLINSELEGLLQTLTDAEMQYKSMKRPNFTGLGIQQQYKNMYE